MFWIILEAFINFDQFNFSICYFLTPEKMVHFMFMHLCIHGH